MYFSSNTDAADDVAAVCLNGHKTALKVLPGTLIRDMVCAESAAMMDREFAGNLRMDQTT